MQTERGEERREGLHWGWLLLVSQDLFSNRIITKEGDAAGERFFWRGQFLW